MYKELVICIVIIVSIFSLDMFTQGYTNRSVEEISKKIEELEQNITTEDKETIDDQLNNINHRWEMMHKKLAYYIEHNEIEKVDTAFVNMESYIKSEEYASAKAQLEEGKFILKHIKQKYSFNLQNIF